MNPLQLLQLKNLWDAFTQRHPKFPKFLSAVRQQGIQEGSVIEIQITSPDGKTYASNLKLSDEDIEMIDKLREIKK